MAAAAHGDTRMGVPQDVAKEFFEADRRIAREKKKKASFNPIIFRAIITRR